MQLNSAGMQWKRTMNWSVLEDICIPSRRMASSGDPRSLSKWSVYPGVSERSNVRLQGEPHSGWGRRDLAVGRDHTAALIIKQNSKLIILSLSHLIFHCGPMQLVFKHSIVAAARMSMVVSQFRMRADKMLQHISSIFWSALWVISLVGISSFITVLLNFLFGTKEFTVKPISINCKRFSAPALSESKFAAWTLYVLL